MSAESVNPDLVKERSSATFDVETLTDFMYGGRNAVRRRRYLQNVAFQDKYLQTLNTKPWCNLTREEEYDVALKKGVYLNKLVTDLDITSQAENGYLQEAVAPQEVNPLGLHRSMFLPTILKLGTPEQVEKYAKAARQCKIIGTYAQTELGHGTFIRGLETTATFDPATDEFVIHSPTLTSMKYWPGALGKTSNHVVLMAQLYSGGRCYGIHSFVVQIRSLDDHKPLPGVTVGDIGNKLGYNSIDNGFLIFNNYRVPREAMLMRYAKLEKDSTYTPPANAKLTYGAMVFIRALIVGGCGSSLAKTCTIAIRYSAVRHQSELRPGEPEPQVIEYQTQQEKLFTNLATAYALVICGGHMKDTYNKISAQIEKGRLDEVQVLHAISAGMKALSSYLSSEGINTLRMACGGHGYSHASGIPKIFCFDAPACTFEGENTVMFLQCARYLMKCYDQASRGHQLPGFMAYLNTSVNTRSNLDNTCSFTDIVEAYEHTSARLVKDAAVKIQSLMRSGTSLEEARNQTSVQLVMAAIAHSETYLVKTFVDAVQTANLSPKTRPVLEALCKLHAINGLNKRLGQFMQDGFINNSQAEMLLNKQLSLYAEIRPNAVALVDAFDYPDMILQSCIGRYDGRVYEALYEYAKKSPLNKDEVMDSYYSTLRPLMKGHVTDGPAAKL